MHIKSFQGWKTSPVWQLGSRLRVGGENFRHGKRPQVRAARVVAGGEQSLLIANALGDVHAWVDVMAQPRRTDFTIVPDAGETMPLSRSSFPSPDHYRYADVLHEPARGIHRLLVSLAQFGRSDWCDIRGPQADGTIRVGQRNPIENLAGIPAFIDWRRDGLNDLLVGGADGSLLRHGRATDGAMSFATSGEPVLGGEVAIELPGPVCPCAVDWEGGAQGRSDLLVGDGVGRVWLFRDIGDGAAVRYDRGRVLTAEDGEIAVSGPASATVLEHDGQRSLIVADGEGDVWRWPMSQVQSLVSDDLAALSGVCRGWRREGRGLAAAPASLPAGVADHKVIVRFDPPADELTIPLPDLGVCDIHVMLRLPPGCAWGCQVIARLNDDPLGSPLTFDSSRGDGTCELLLIRTDTRGQSLHLRQIVADFRFEGGWPAFVEGVRLTPKAGPSDSRRRSGSNAHPDLQGEPEGPASRGAAQRAAPLRIAAILDAYMWIWKNRTRDAADVEQMVEWHRRAGFGLIYYKLGGAAWEYPSRVPGADSVGRPDLEEFTDADRDFCERTKALWESVDRVGLTIESCHRRNMQCYAWLRIQNEGEHIHGRFPFSRFYVEHQHMREKNINGSFVPGKLCLAYDEVRQFYLALVTEAMQKGADGVMIDTMRHLPKVMYGDPVVEAFKAKHGIDMRSLPPFDPRVMQAQIDVMTDFLREVRKAMRAVKPDAELHVRVCKPHPLMGCDPGAWAKQGVVDVVLIEDRVGARRPDLPGMIEAAGNAAATAYSFTRPHWGREKGPLHPARVAEEAAWARRLGAPMIAFYESADIIDRPDMVRAIRALNG